MAVVERQAETREKQLNADHLTNVARVNEEYGEQLKCLENEVKISVELIEVCRISTVI